LIHFYKREHVETIDVGGLSDGVGGNGGGDKEAKDQSLHGADVLAGHREFSSTQRVSKKYRVSAEGPQRGKNDRAGQG